MKAKRWLTLALLALGVVTLLAAGLRPRPVKVELAEVTTGPLRVTVVEEGKSRVIDRFVVSAPVAGYARRIELKVGDAVAKGAPLARLEPLRSTVLDPRSRAEALARVAAAEAALASARQAAEAAAAEAELAAVEFRRVERLCRDKCVSEEEVDQARARMRSSAADRRSAEFTAEVARFELEAARTALQHSAAQPSDEPAETVTLTAPVAGRVLAVPRESEGVVEAGQALIELGDPRALEVAVEVLSADAVRIHPGTPVLFERWGGEGELEGVVRRIEPSGFTKVSALGVEEQRVHVIADITSPQERWERLGDGYRVEARFVLWEGQEVLQLPMSALFREGPGWACFVAEEGVARRRPVELGRRNGLQAQVLSGLAVGERVIVHPSDLVTDGVRVATR